MELIDDAKHWHERAEESRALAEQMTNPDAQRLMYCIAASYQRLVQRAEERLRGCENGAKIGVSI